MTVANVVVDHRKSQRSGILYVTNSGHQAYRDCSTMTEAIQLYSRGETEP